MSIPRERSTERFTLTNPDPLRDPLRRALDDRETHLPPRIDGSPLMPPVDPQPASSTSSLFTSALTTPVRNLPALATQFARLLLPTGGHGARQRGSGVDGPRDSDLDSETDPSTGAKRPSLLERLQTLRDTVTSGIRSMGERCRNAFSRLGSARSIGDFFGLLGSAVAEVARGIGDLIATTVAALTSAGDQSAAQPQEEKPKERSFTDLLVAVTRDELLARDRQRRAETEEPTYLERYITRDREQSDREQRAAVRTAETVSAPFLDPGTIADLKLAKIVNHVQSPESNRVDALLEEIERKETSTGTRTTRTV